MSEYKHLNGKAMGVECTDMGEFVFVTLFILWVTGVPVFGFNTLKAYTYLLSLLTDMVIGGT